MKHEAGETSEDTIVSVCISLLLTRHDYHCGDDSTTTTGANWYTEGTKKSTDEDEVLRTELLHLTIVHHNTPREKRPQRRRCSCAVRWIR